MSCYMFAVPASEVRAQIRNVLVDIAGETASRLSPFQKFANAASGFDNVSRQAMHPKISIIANDQPLFLIEHTKSLRHVIQGCVNAGVGLLELVRFFGYFGLSLCERRFRIKKATQLPAQLPQKKYRAGYGK